MTHSIDFRLKVLEVKKDEGLSFAKVAKRFGVGLASVVRWTKRPEPKKHRNKPAVKLDMEALKKDIALYPDAYQYERAERLGVSPMGICHALKRMKVTYKKTLKHPKVDPEKRFAFCQKLRSYKEAGHPIVPLDESGFSHDMPRTHGYSLRGTRCEGSHDWGAKGRTNVLGALFQGLLLTVSLFSSSINTEIFTQWMINDLIPKLPPRSVLILDNASFHMGTLMKRAIADAGHILLYLPPYSPDLNPIERKWAQAKAIRRKKRCSIDLLFREYVL